MMSSLQALASQLGNMAERDSRLRSAAADARALAERNPETAELRGLLAQFTERRKNRSSDWRVIVFTLPKETHPPRRVAARARHAGTLRPAGRRVHRGWLLA